MANVGLEYCGHSPILAMRQRPGDRLVVEEHDRSTQVSLVPPLSKMRHSTSLPPFIAVANSISGPTESGIWLQKVRHLLHAPSTFPLSSLVSRAVELHVVTRTSVGLATSLSTQFLYHSPFHIPNPSTKALYSSRIQQLTLFFALENPNYFKRNHIMRK